MMQEGCTGKIPFLVAFAFLTTIADKPRVFIEQRFQPLDVASVERLDRVAEEPILFALQPARKLIFSSDYKLGVGQPKASYIRQ